MKPLPKSEWQYRLYPGFIAVAKFTNDGFLHWEKRAIPAKGYLLSHGSYAGGETYLVVDEFDVENDWNSEN